MRFNVERLEARMHLDDLLRFGAADPGSTDSIGAINLALVNPADGPRVARDLTARNPVLTVRSTAREGADTPFVVLDRFHLAIAIVTVAGSTAFLLALMVIRAEERRETIGILQLIGISTKSILFEVIVEGLLIAVVGALFGVLIATVGQHGVNRFFQARYDTTLVFVRITPSIVLQAIAIALPAGVVAGAVASWNVLRRRSSQ
jgi:cell division protein FtsX